MTPATLPDPSFAVGPVTGRAELSTLVARFSFAWLAVANLAGLLLATMLLYPELNDLLAPLTYGRWAPVHLNAQLYGWCALPLVGLLLRAFLAPGSRVARRHARWALVAWSAALAFGAGAWLAGQSSGKLFLDWTGAARIAFPAALTVLWSVLAYHAGLRIVGEGRALAIAGSGRDAESRPGSATLQFANRRPLFPHLLRFGLLAGLLAVPTVMYFAADPKLYPAINPDSGGATGTSLFGSTLALVVIYAAAPDLLGLPFVAGRQRSRALWPALIAGGLLFAMLAHGHVSHHVPGQIAGLGLLGFAPWLLARAWRRRRWQADSALWLGAALVWGALLVANGWFSFLPGISERLKFTNGLVAHAHLAMAGLITSLNAVFLLNAGEARPVRAALANRRLFWLWQAGCALQIVALLVLGWREAADPQLVFDREMLAQFVYGVRWLAGAAMTAGSVAWLVAVWRKEPRIQTPAVS